MKGHNHHPSLIVILGPTASGKTRLAVRLAEQLNGAIISADSRQVYRGMDIGTGKDLTEYGDIPHYLIDLVAPGTAYHLAQYRRDFPAAMQEIYQRGQQPILCGGSGLYIQSVLQQMPYSDVPVHKQRRAELHHLATSDLRQLLSTLSIPADFKVDTSTKKRLIRAIEIAEWMQSNALPQQDSAPPKAVIFGLNPDVETRRTRITARLKERIQNGLLDEVKRLMASGVSSEQLLYYGLEYKYVTQYLLGELDYNTFFARLNTEIHRFAKRQMTYFRKMEKDGLQIHWLKENDMEKMAEEIRARLAGYAAD